MRPPPVLIGLLLLSGLALAWPRAFGSSAFDPFLASTGGLWGLIALAMFAIGWRLPRDEVAQVARRWPAVLGGTAVQYAAMPALAYLAARLSRLDADATVGLILVGCVPGAMASNVLTLMARGNVSYSVSLTTLATVASPVVVPLTLRVALGGISVDFPAADAMRQLSLFVVLPVGLGHALGRARPGWARAAGPVAEAAANLAILWIIAVVVAANRDRLAVPDARLIAALLAVNLLGYLAGDLGGRALCVDRPMRRALTLEVGMQNAGLGTTIALSLFPDRPAVAIPCALYTFGCMLTGTALASWWGRDPVEARPAPP
ncbi:bile acid:sodium symporter family protein [Tautonia plasticadhaerens]|uniref:Sodium Bile acid symporter family protein n=1 Tax=Tautonia plasticadhaerens TaxID=2527974 RepID=A0A518HCY4_9BACT|nr:bile acid:sodium symporter family protein [Tautonia plasticadhaerens]QDV38728.1 Sodium Bile acid symporter family protein [Tautonia plasticadhaerens]